VVHKWLRMQIEVFLVAKYLVVSLVVVFLVTLSDVVIFSLVSNISSHLSVSWLNILGQAFSNFFAEVPLSHRLRLLFCLTTSLYFDEESGLVVLQPSCRSFPSPYDLFSAVCSNPHLILMLNHLLSPRYFPECSGLILTDN